jgi:hypothetical protein
MRTQRTIVILQPAITGSYIDNENRLPAFQDLPSLGEGRLRQSTPAGRIGISSNALLEA